MLFLIVSPFDTFSSTSPTNGEKKDIKPLSSSLLASEISSHKKSNVMADPMIEMFV